MKIITKTLIFIVLMDSFFLNAIGQEENDNVNRPFQITLLPPIGTNGPEYRQCVNQISLNVLWGESAGLRGLELAGLANIEHQFVKGIQLAGFGNFNKGNTLGLSASGFMNMTHDLTGASLAGFMTTGDDVKGLAGAGFMNISGKVIGVQASGFMNIADEVTGAQLSDFMNISTTVEGAQVTGFMNTSGMVKGAQVSGFMNIGEDVTGAQVSGFMNIAENVRGTQVGFINIAENYESGVPVGLINIIENGYHDFEISTSEIWNASLGYRMGVDALYSQFFVGSHWTDQDDFWGFGFGIGTRFPITHYFKGSVDLISWQLIEGGKLWAPRPNLIEQARLTIEGRIFRHLSWFVGPTFNFLIVPFEYPEPDFLAHFDPWSIYENTSGISYLKMWPGIQGGIRF
ncbi:MAG: hypothetical protein V2A67_06660 [Bacteroidota bacterium]